MSTALELKQTSLNAASMGLGFTTVDKVKLLGFFAVVVSQCSKQSCDSIQPTDVSITVIMPTTFPTVSATIIGGAIGGTFILIILLLVVVIIIVAQRKKWW